jgi:hypothetical protein
MYQVSGKIRIHMNIITTLEISLRTDFLRLNGGSWRVIILAAQ